MGAQSWSRDLNPLGLGPSKVAAVTYAPGGAGPAGAICLSTNEAPWPPSEHVIDVIARTARNGHIYPDPMGEPLRSAVAEHHGVPVSSVFISSGADGILDGCFRAFIRPGDEVRISKPTYPVLTLLCAVYSAVPVVSPWPLRTGAKAAVATFVVNPNSPTGTWIPPASLRQFVAKEPGIVIVDEAYAPFAGGSMTEFVDDHSNELVVRTFSKAYSLAGMRVGYAVGSAALISELRAAHLPYPTSSCALAAAMAALADPTRHRDMISLVTAERARVSRKLIDLGWKVPPSHANFLYTEPPGGAASAVQRRLAESGIQVRFFPTIDPTKLRITIANRPANDAFLSAATKLSLK